MKQCPNPNCIYYTRLEELPDAYVRCPGCGGLLVDANLQSGKLRSETLVKQGNLAARDLDQEFEEAFPGGVPSANSRTSSRLSGSLIGVPIPGDDSDEDADGYEEGEYDPYALDQSQQYAVGNTGNIGGTRTLSLLSKIAYVLGGLLLIGACGLFGLVVFTRVIPQQGSLLGVDATQTALVAQHPAVNTPISELPTASSLPGASVPTLPPAEPPATDTPQPVEPTSVAVEPPAPTDTPVPPPPADTPVASQPTAPVNATAPPAQQEPTGGVLDAFMTGSLQSGQPADRISTYAASDAFLLAVQAQFGAGGVTSIRTRWYGPDNGLLFELPRSFSLAGTYYSTFTLKKDSPWVEGAYRVDIYTNESASPDFSVSFAVAP